MNKTTPWIMHIDGDGFFAYCEIARSPHLRGKPIVVGEDRGIACAMTYEAKALGVTRGMPIFKIREEFPQVITLYSHFELYEHYANKLAHLLEPAVVVLERYSIDECFALVHLPSDWSHEQILAWLQELKDTVQRQIGLTYSFGLARTKVLAKVASKLEKPNGCTCIMPANEQQVLQRTPIESIWGIGRRLSRRFQNIRLTTADEFARWTEPMVQAQFTIPIQELWHELNGRPMFAVSTDSALPKSLQSTKSFSPSSTELSFIVAELLQNIDIVFARMRSHGLATNAASIFLKTTERRYHGTTISFAHYTDNPLAVSAQIIQEAKLLFQKGVRYKATGITVWELRSRHHVQSDMFGEQQSIIAGGEVMHAVDAIRRRYGHRSIGILGAQASTNERLRKATIRNAKETYVSGLPLAYLGEVY